MKHRLQAFVRYTPDRHVCTCSFSRSTLQQQRALHHFAGSVLNSWWLPKFRTRLKSLLECRGQMLHWALYPILHTGKTPREVAWRFFADFRPQPQREKPEEKVNQLCASTIKREPPYDLAVVAPCQKRPTDTKRSIVTARPFVSALFVSQSPCPWNIPLSPVPIATNGWGNRYTHSNTWISFVDRKPR